MTEPRHTNLPRFQAALPAYRATLATDTYRRYYRGIYPKFVRWLIQHPDLVHAFCADATDMHRSSDGEQSS
jgi:hypothetical protein